LNKGLARLIFLIVFLIPVAWYLILQLLGDNNFSLEKKSDLNDCISPSGVMVIKSDDSVSIAKKNYLDRVTYLTSKRDITLQEKGEDFFSCINQTEADLVLINEEGLWGSYELSREGVDLLITELDILLLQSSYGEGAYR